MLRDEVAAAAQVGGLPDEYAAKAADGPEASGPTGVGTDAVATACCCASHCSCVSHLSMFLARTFFLWSCSRCTTLPLRCALLSMEGGSKTVATLKLSGQSSIHSSMRSTCFLYRIRWLLQGRCFFLLISCVRWQNSQSRPLGHPSERAAKTHGTHESGWCFEPIEVSSPSESSSGSVRTRSAKQSGWCSPGTASMWPTPSDSSPEAPDDDGHRRT